ncbi:hypothetical protein [Flavobacterium sp. H122]|uniref:hypothetical protein n=1 Tax=Flavobacterium sp. H122 TaxID=2529860 RepID=UPI0020BF695E|nr:hypothetical protein [Flavobacterium sp. H122]
MKKLFLLIVLFLFFSCEKKSSNASFYYWRTQFDLSKEENEILQSNEVKKLYVRYFDVALANNQPFPLAPIHFLDKKVNQEIIPVVFIKNEIFLSKSVDLNDLKDKILGLIDQINKSNNIKDKEIQIDCDWSLQSRDRYIQFLTLIKKEYKKTISVTIRLHQIKYFKETKVPPVDYGVLMFYNMGQLTANGTNSIYDKNIAVNYIYHLKNYPLKLKIALPIFSWYVHSRDGKVINLLSKLDKRKFENNPCFEISTSTISVKKNTLFNGFFFKKNDKLRLEEITENDLDEMKELLQNKLPYKPEEIIFYDLNTKNLKNYTNEFFFKTFTADF